MAEVPYFLNPTAAPLDMNGNIDIFNYDTLKGVAYDGSVKSVWDELAGIPQAVTKNVYDSVSGTWHAVTDFAGDAADSFSSKISNFIDAVKTNFLILLVGTLVVVWILAKSGILPQAAQLIGSIKGIG